MNAHVIPGELREAAAPIRFARAPLFALGAMVIATVVTVAAVRITGVGAVHAPDAAAVATREFGLRPRKSLMYLPAAISLSRSMPVSMPRPCSR